MTAEIEIGIEEDVVTLIHTAVVVGTVHIAAAVVTTPTAGNFGEEVKVTQGEGTTETATGLIVIVIEEVVIPPRIVILQMTT